MYSPGAKFSFQLVTAPPTPIYANDPVDLSQMYAWLNQTDDLDSNTVLPTLIVAARQAIEDWTGRAIVTQTWNMFLDQFPIPNLGIYAPGSPFVEAPIQNNTWPVTPDIWAIKIPKSPIQSITSVTYTDANQVQQTMPTSGYSVDLTSAIPRIFPVPGGYWPTSANQPNAVQIQFIAGYTIVPQTLVMAIQMLAAQWYETREGVVVGAKGVEMPMSVKALIASYRLRDAA